MNASNVYLSLGSNKGDRFLNLKNALELLKEEEKITLVKVSKIYETKPVLPTSISHPSSTHPDYLNAACWIQTELSPYALLEKTQAIEKKLGQISSEKNLEPRFLDIDILFFEKVTMQEERLTLPHPRWEERLFVLIPLQEITKEVTFPDGKRVLLQDAIDAILNKEEQEIKVFSKE